MEYPVHLIATQHHYSAFKADVSASLEDALLDVALAEFSFGQFILQCVHQLRNDRVHGATETGKGAWRFPGRLG